MGTMSIHGDFALFYSGIVSPKYRGQGLQRSLIRKRQIDAKKLGIEYIFATGVPPYSASEANLKSESFELLGHRTIWEHSES